MTGEMTYSSGQITSRSIRRVTAAAAAAAAIAVDSDDDDSDDDGDHIAQSAADVTPILLGLVAYFPARMSTNIVLCNLPL